MKRRMDVISRSRIIFLVSLAILCMFVVPVSATTGGPDSFGYTFTDSISGGTSYNWIDITGTGTPILFTSVDDASTVIPLPFVFNYYGTNYNQLYVSTNGLIVDYQTSPYSNYPIGASPSVHGFIAPFWDDLRIANPEAAIYYETIGTSPNRMFIIEWKDISHYYGTGAITFEVILYEGSNQIKFQYYDVDFGSPSYNNAVSATVGIENQAGNDGLQYSFNQPVLDEELAILFNYPVGSTSVPEFPSLALPAAMVIGLLGAVLMIQRTKEY
jgi:hypothetical protein